MSRQIQIRRGTAAENNAFTGAIGEVTMDTTNKTLRVHDGTTAGGTIMAKQSEIPDLTDLDYVVESQFPTADNNYTWYRKYKSGWVEQGGSTTSTENGSTCALPITMNDNHFTALVTVDGDNSSNYSTAVTTKHTTYIKISTYTEQRPCSWYVCGMSAS